ncbi:MAG: hypothetical protein ABIO49_06505 [Dokdonella sp.]
MARDLIAAERKSRTQKKKTVANRPGQGNPFPILSLTLSTLHLIIRTAMLDRPWVRVDGVPAALSKAALKAPGFSQLTSISTRADTPLGPGDFMLSATNSDGVAVGTHCANATSAASTDTQVPGWGHFVTWPRTSLAENLAMRAKMALVCQRLNQPNASTTERHTTRW